MSDKPHRTLQSMVISPQSQRACGKAMHGSSLPHFSTPVKRV